MSDPFGSPAMAAHTLTTIYGVRREWSSHEDRETRWDYAAGLPDDGHPYDRLFTQHVLLDAGGGRLPYLVGRIPEDLLANAPDDVLDYAQAEDERARRAYEEVVDGLPASRPARLVHLNHLRSAMEAELDRLEASFQTAQDGVRDALAPLVAYAARLSEWTPDHAKDTPIRWYDNEPVTDEVVKVSVSGLYSEASNIYSAAVRSADEAAPVALLIHGLCERYGVPQTAGYAQWTGVRRWLPELVRARRNGAAALALHEAAVAVADEVLAGAAHSAEGFVDAQGQERADAVARAAARVNFDEFARRTVARYDEGTKWRAAYDEIAGWAGGSPFKTFDSFARSKAKRKAKP